MKLTSFEERLIEWTNLRKACTGANVDLLDVLNQVNDWWCLLPIDNQYLHFADKDTWPDPWELLNDGVFDNLSKALGIAYTLILINRYEITSIQVALNHDYDVVVLVNNGEYILNWSPKTLLNTSSKEIKILETVDSSVLKQRIH